MKRRDFLISSASLAAAGLPVLGNAASKPCPPGSLSIAGGTTTTTSCGMSSGSLPVLILSSAAPSGTYPWTFGQAFRKGDFTAGAVRAASGASAFQADVRSTWADGSVKFAVLSGISSFAGSPVSVAIGTSGTLTTGTNVAEPNVPASVQFSSPAVAVQLATARTNGSMSWTKATAHKIRESLGPVMSEFHYYSPVSGDNHLAVWWYVRAYSSGAVEVETVIENGWLLVASPAAKSYAVTVTVGASTVYGPTALTHNHHTRWSRVDWVGTDPAVTPKHDTAYLQSTSLVPTYAVASLNAAAYTDYPQGGTKYASYTRASAYRPTPFVGANIDPALGSGGDTDNYGIVPAWDAAYLIEGNVGAYYAVLANARAGGRFSTHYRSESDGRPARGSVNTTLGLSDTNPGIYDNAGNNAVLTPAPSGGYNQTWYYTHGPSIGYLAYLLDGRWPHLEEVQFIAATHDFTQSGNVYNGFRYISRTKQVREIAWGLRNQAQALTISPDTLNGTVLSSGSDYNQLVEFRGRLTSFVDYYYGACIGNTVTSAGMNSMRGSKLGVWWSNTDYDDYGGTANDGQHESGGMMQGFISASLLYAYDLELPLATGTTTWLGELCKFIAQWPVGILGGTGTSYDWRMSSWYQCSYGTPGGEVAYDAAPAIYRASWDAQWAHVASHYKWVGGSPFPLPSDNYLRTAAPSSTAPYHMVLSTSTTLGTSSHQYAMTWAAAYAHKVSDRLSIPGITKAAGNLYNSTTWTNAKAGVFKSDPRLAVFSDRWTA